MLASMLEEMVLSVSARRMLKSKIPSMATVAFVPSCSPVSDSKSDPRFSPSRFTNDVNVARLRLDVVGVTMVAFSTRTINVNATARKARNARKSSATPSRFL